MKKTFPFTVPGKERARVIDAIKYDIRKYVKRERRKTLPEGFTAWDFACRVGADGSVAIVQPLGDVARAIDSVAADEATQVYVEILAAPGYRTVTPVGDAAQRPSAQAATPPSFGDAAHVEKSS